MRSTSVNGLLAKAGILVFAITLTAAGAGLFSAFVLGGKLESAKKAAEIGRNHMDADMMHDALRADVLAALASSDPLMQLDVEEVKKDTRDHSARFRQSIEANAALATNPAIQKVLAEVKPKLEGYIAAATAIVTKAESDRAQASAALPAFMADFHSLEDEMEKASDTISAVTAAEVADGHRLAGLTQGLTIAVLIVGLIMLGALQWAARRMLVNPIVDLTDAMNKLAGGDIAGVTPHAQRSDEIGRMAAALTLFRENSIARLRLEEERQLQDAESQERTRRIEALMAESEAARVKREAELRAEEAERAERARRIDALTAENEVARLAREAEQKAQDLERQERARRIEELVSAFGQELSEGLRALGKSSEGLRSQASQLDAIAISASDSSHAAMGSTSGASSNVQSIAGATSELSASIQEISSQMASSAAAATKAATFGRSADQTVKQLTQAAHGIGDIVAVIGAVASQTNLLALNATIEAARAGEAGKGFAVVASEVKTLANQTSRATEDISTRIAEIQGISARSVSEVQTVISLISQMQDIASAVAAAAEEQSVATRGIAQNVTDAAASADVAVASVSELAQATTRTQQASSTVQASAQAVERLTLQLKSASERFFQDLRAA